MSSAEVEAYLAGLDHPRVDEVRRLRDALLAADDGLSETVKWNAPSFRFAGEDRVTFRLRPGDRVQLILHRGAKVRDDVGAFRFDDPEGMVEWATPDRGVVTIADAADLEARRGVILALVRRWVRA